MHIGKVTRTAVDVCLTIQLHVASSVCGTNISIVSTCFSNFCWVFYDLYTYVCLCVCVCVHVWVYPPDSGRISSFSTWVPGWCARSWRLLPSSSLTLVQVTQLIQHLPLSADMHPHCCFADIIACAAVCVLVLDTF